MNDTLPTAAATLATASTSWWGSFFAFFSRGNVALVGGGFVVGLGIGMLLMGNAIREFSEDVRTLARKEMRDDVDYGKFSARLDEYLSGGYKQKPE